MPHPFSLGWAGILHSSHLRRGLKIAFGIVGRYASSSLLDTPPRPRHCGRATVVRRGGDGSARARALIQICQETGRKGEGDGLQ